MSAFALAAVSSVGLAPALAGYGIPALVNISHSYEP